MVKITEVLDPIFYDIYKDIKKGKYTHYWLGGGRGSLKSSSTSIILIMKIIRTKDLHAVIFRKTGNTLKDSVYEQIKWAIDILGVSRYFTYRVSPLEIIYTPTGQRIFFRGLDEPEKIKGMKVHKGYFGLIWFEELQQYYGMEEVRKAYQSLMRGTDEPIQILCTYNPPKEINNWVNKDELTKRSDRIIHKSTYLDIKNKHWLGRQFIADAEELKKVNELAYNNEYLGIATGSGGKIFNNVEELVMTDNQVNDFDRVRYGLDWGYTTDPLAFIKLHYDKTRKIVYMFDEVYKTHLLNTNAIEIIKPKLNTYDYIIYADSAEPKSISEFQQERINIMGAIKGKDSVKYGIEFLQSLNKIIIDPIRCPNAFKEFSTYEQERDKNGEFKVGYPDKNNHLIDALRYSLNDEIRDSYNGQSSADEWANIF